MMDELFASVVLSLGIVVFASIFIAHGVADRDCKLAKIQGYDSTIKEFISCEVRVCNETFSGEAIDDAIRVHRYYGCKQ